MKKMWTIGTVTLVVALNTTAAWAQPAGPPDAARHASDGPRMAVNHGPCGGPGMMPDEEALRKAGATEQQIQALEETGYEAQLKCIDLRAAAEKANVKLVRLMKSADPDEKAILATVDELAETRGALFRLDVASFLSVRKILGEDVLRKLWEQEPRRPGGPGWRPPFGPGPRQQEMEAPPEHSSEGSRL